MHTKNINLKKNNVNNCVFSTDGYQNYLLFLGNFIICHVLKHLLYNFESYGFRTYNTGVRYNVLKFRISSINTLVVFIY